MSKAVFFNLPAHGHINPSLPVVGELVRRGEQVIYYATDDFRPAIEATGAVFRSYGDLALLRPQSREESMIRFVLRLMQASQVIIQHLLPELRAERPDYIILDSLCPWGNFIAQILAVPAICSSTLLVFSLRSAMSVPVDILNKSRMLFSDRDALRQIITLVRQMTKEYHIKDFGPHDILTNYQRLTLVYTSRMFQPFADRLDERFRFVGISIQPRSDKSDFPFSTLTDKPLVYVSLGTIFNHDINFYRTCFAAFADCDWQIVVSVGRQIAIEDLGPIPANCIVRASVPQLELLQRTTLFITHAGMNSTSEALYYGVPMIAIPQDADQHLVAKRIEQLGAGKVMQKGRLQPEQLYSIAEKIIREPSYQSTSAAIGESLREAGGYQRAADEIIAYVSASHVTAS